MPGGSLSGWNAVLPISWMPRARSVPAMVKRPSLNSMSASDASRRCAASFLPLAMIFSLTRTLAPRGLGGGARPPGPHAEGDRVGVALDELDGVGIDAEPIDEDLRLD